MRGCDQQMPGMIEKNNIAVAGVIAEQDRFMVSINQLVENNNRFT
jgi:hypothetical protein